MLFDTVLIIVLNNYTESSGDFSPFSHCGGGNTKSTSTVGDPGSYMYILGYVGRSLSTSTLCLTRDEYPMFLPTLSHISPRYGRYRTPQFLFSDLTKYKVTVTFYGLKGL